MIRTFKEMLQTDEVIRLFVLARLIHPLMVEMFGLAGKFQGFWIDQEHGAATRDEIASVALAGRANGFDCFVRMPPIGYWAVTQAFEAGAGGVMGAQILDAEHAEEFVKWTKFPPRGTRGLNNGGRDADYTYKQHGEFIEHADRSLLSVIQIETLGSLEDADAIAGIDGVDALFVGPADLSLALGIVGQFEHEKLWDAIHRVAAACRNHGKAWGIVAPNGTFADRSVEAGCRLLSMAVDVGAIRKGIDAYQAAFASQF